MSNNKVSILDKLSHFLGILKDIIGSTTPTTDLSKYATKEQVDTVDEKFANYTTTEDLDSKLNEYVKKEQLNGLDIKPSEFWVSKTDANGEPTDIPYLHYYEDNE